MLNEPVHGVVILVTTIGPDGDMCINGTGGKEKRFTTSLRFYLHTVKLLPKRP
jgi:hypothetical protein